MAQLEFYPDKHEYLLDGKRIPSVTEIVGIYSTQRTEADEENEDSLSLVYEIAAERGTILHGYIAHLLQGGNAADYEMPDAYGGYASAAELFLAERHIEPCAIETPMWGIVDGLEIAGTPDLSAYCNNELTIFDYKFVATVDKTKVGAQLNGYNMLCEYNGIFHEKLTAVQFIKDGTYRLYPAEINLFDFLLSVQIYKAKHKKHPRGGIA